MDTSYLADWNVKEQQRRAEFMEHMYKCSGRTNGLFTNLWQDFCLKEAGPYCMNMFFDRREAIENYIKVEQEKQAEAQKADTCEPQEFIPTLHD